MNFSPLFILLWAVLCAASWCIYSLAVSHSQRRSSAHFSLSGKATLCSSDHFVSKSGGSRFFSLHFQNSLKHNCDGLFIEESNVIQINSHKRIHKFNLPFRICYQILNLHLFAKSGEHCGLVVAAAYCSIRVPGSPDPTGGPPAARGPPLQVRSSAAAPPEDTGSSWAGPGRPAPRSASFAQRHPDINIRSQAGYAISSQLTHLNKKCIIILNIWSCIFVHMYGKNRSRTKKMQIPNYSNQAFKTQCLNSKILSVIHWRQKFQGRFWELVLK